MSLWDVVSEVDLVFLEDHVCVVAVLCVYPVGTLVEYVVTHRIHLCLEFVVRLVLMHS